jgi:hypothetical protein
MSSSTHLIEISIVASSAGVRRKAMMAVGT